jgi:hypothetical protein
MGVLETTFTIGLEIGIKMQQSRMEGSNWIKLLYDLKISLIGRYWDIMKDNLTKFFTMDVWKNYENFTHNIVLSFTGYQILDIVTFREHYAKLFDKLICYRDYVGGCEDRRCEDESPTDDSKKTLPTQVFWQWRVSKTSDFEEVKNYIKSKMESRTIVMNTTNKVWVLLLQMLDDILDRTGMKVWLDLWCCQGGLRFQIIP